MAHHIPFPHFLGKSNSSLLEYESEKFPQSLRQGQKIALGLKPPTKDHWNIALDLFLPMVLEDSRQRCEAKRAARAQEEKPMGAKVSQTEAPTPGECQLEVEGSGKTLPTETAPNSEHVLETTHRILERIHALHLQTVQEMGSMQELDQTLARTLMAEFARLQLIVGEDFTKSLIALRTDLEASSETLMSDIVRTVDFHPDDPASCQVRAALQKFQQTTSLKVNLPLMELQAAHEDMEEFMQSCLQEISSQTESQELIRELSQKLTDHTSRVRQLVQVPELTEGEVFLQVLIGLGVHQPLKANFFPGILEGLVGRLGLVPSGMTDPPTSVRAGMSHHWAPLGRLSEGQREEISTSGRSQVLWCLAGSIWTMTWIFKQGGSMT